MEKTIILIFFGAYSFLLGFMLHKYLINSSNKYNIQKANIQGIRWETQTKPLFGGVTFFSIFIFGIINYAVLLNDSIVLDSSVVGIILVATISFLIGLADDLLNSSPFFKFLAQIACALLLINFNIYITIFSTPILNYILTIFWVVGIMNSINMLDNMDAITSSVSLTIMLAMIFLVVVSGGMVTWFYLFVLVSIIAGVGSFLIFNWKPSKMYMGDSGSMFLGVLLAIFGILFLWNIPTTVPGHSILIPSVVTWLVFTVPITDTSVVSINRLLRGQSPFVGGRDHTTHFLSYMGLKEPQIAFVLIFITLISITLAGILIFVIKNPSLIQICSFAAWPALILIVMIVITKTIKPKITKPNA